MGFRAWSEVLDGSLGEHMQKMTVAPILFKPAAPRKSRVACPVVPSRHSGGQAGHKSSIVTWPSALTWRSLHSPSYNRGYPGEDSAMQCTVGYEFGRRTCSRMADACIKDSSSTRKAPYRRLTHVLAFAPRTSSYKVPVAQVRIRGFRACRENYC